MLTSCIYNDPYFPSIMVISRSPHFHYIERRSRPASKLTCGGHLILDDMGIDRTKTVWVPWIRITFNFHGRKEESNFSPLEESFLRRSNGCKIDSPPATCMIVVTERMRKQEALRIPTIVP